MTIRSSFVPEALFASRPSFAWKGELAHIGPTNTANSLYKKLAKHPYCGSLALISGVLQWGASAFAAVRDVGPHLELARIHFLVMEPLGYKDVDWDGLADFAWPKQRKEDQALGTLLQLARQAIVPGAWLDTQGRPISNLFHLVYLTRHVIGSHRAAFDRWLEAANVRTLGRGRASFKATTGNVARDHTWGHPLPPSILERDVKPVALLAERAGLAAELKGNRFYAPVASYLDKLSKADAAIVKGLGVKRVEHLADHAKSELGSVELWPRMILQVELAAKGRAFRAEPPAPRAAKAAKSAKPSKPWKAVAVARPAFVPEAVLGSRPSFAWGGNLTVLEQGREMDGFVRAYGRHSYCATLALISGVVQWCACAFAAVRDVSEHLALAQMHFLVMEPAGFHALALEPLFERARPTKPKEDGALTAAFMHAARAIHPKVWITYDLKSTPIYELAQLVHLTRLVLAQPHRTAFDAWLAAADKRIKRLGATPYAAKTGKPQRDKIWGHPLPPEILERDVEARELMLLRRPFLAALRASKHLFLR